MEPVALGQGVVGQALEIGGRKASVFGVGGGGFGGLSTEALDSFVMAGREDVEHCCGCEVNRQEIVNED